MTVNDDDPVVTQYPSPRDSSPVPKKLGLEKKSPNRHENFASQGEEREWVDALLGCSQPEEQFEAVVNCMRWDEICTGWRHTLPNVTYISRAPESNSKKDAEKEKEKENSKYRNSQKLISFESDLAWKNCIEPGTYRYVHKSAYAGIPKKKTFNKGPVKRPVDAHLQEHIRKVKEHLEKVLVNQAEPRGNQRPLGSVHNHGDYVASLIRDAKPYRHQPYAHLDITSSPRLSNLVEEQSQTKVPDVGLTYTVKRSTSPPAHKSPLPHHPPSHNPEDKVPTDLVSALGSKLNDLIQQDNFKHRIVTTKPSKSKTEEKPRASYEKFTAPAQVESPGLKPLVKVTPSQRKIHDDNDFISAVAKMNKHSTTRSEGSQVSYCTSPSLSKENQYISLREPNGARGEDIRLRLDPANKNFFTSGISGKAVSPSDIDVHMRLQKNLAAGMSSTLGKNPAKVKKRGTLYPQKLGPLPVGSRGDQGFHVANRLADPLHRGVVDREVASAIASELLPGVSGHKIRFPLQHAYRIV